MSILTFVVVVILSTFIVFAGLWSSGLLGKALIIMMFGNLFTT